MNSSEWAREKKVCEHAEKTGWLILKFTPDGQRGWPDRLFINQYGVHVYIEFKRPAERLKRLQAYRLWQLLSRGCYAYGPIDTVEHGKAILDTHVDETRVDSPRVPAFCIKIDAESGERGAIS